MINYDSIMLYAIILCNTYYGLFRRTVMKLLSVLLIVFLLFLIR